MVLDFAVRRVSYQELLLNLIRTPFFAIVPEYAGDWECDAALSRSSIRALSRDGSQA